MENQETNNDVKDARKKRTTVNRELLKIIRVQISNGISNKDISALNCISLSCATKLCNKISKGLSDDRIIVKKGRKKVTNAELKSQVSAIVQSDNALTQVGMTKVLENQGMNKSQPTISRLLKTINVTRKRLSLVPVERNSPNILNLRRDYGIEMESIPLSRMVFLDETGFNLHTAQHYGYSPKNTKAYAMVKANRGINESLMCAIDINGVIGFEMESGAYNGDSFKSFIQSTLKSYFRKHRDSILIMDNCRFHHRSDVLRLLNEQRILYKFIPPYSPQLNPIEEFFGALKSNYQASANFKRRNKKCNGMVIEKEKWIIISIIRKNERLP